MSNKTLESMSLSTIIFVLIFFFSLGFIIFSFIKTPFTNPLMLFPPLITFCLIIVTAYGQWMPIICNPNFQSISGVNGTVYSSRPIPLSGNRTAYDLCLFKRDVPVNVKKRVARGISGLFTFLAGSIVVRVSAPSHRWEWVKGENSESNCNCLRLHGRLDEVEIETTEGRYMRLLDAQNRKLSWMATELETIQVQLGLAMQVRSKDLDKMSEYLEKISKRVKHVTLMTRGDSSLAPIVDGTENE